MFLLFALSIASGLVALAVRYVLYPHALGLIGFWFLFLFLFGIHLFRLETLPLPEPVMRQPVCCTKYWFGTRWYFCLIRWRCPSLTILPTF